MSRGHPRRVVILGSTGSIGRQALEVVDAHPGEFTVVGLAAARDTATLARQAARHGVGHLAVADTDAARGLAGELDAEVLDGPDAATELAALDADLVVNGITGAVGLRPTLAALAARTPVALANKESLIVGGALVTAAADAAGGRQDYLIPVDSEHSALAQAARAGRRDEVARMVLTASGGPFRGRDADALDGVTPAEALAHPTWEMGPLVTVNSATLMNKGLELIEAHELFDTPFASLDVVVHPQSVVHSMVEFVDGSTIAQLSPPDMRLPIQLAMAWPDRLPHAFTSCDWTRAQQLTFEPVDREVFACLAIAEAAGRRGGSYPAVMNAANEVAVAAFLAERLGFRQIARVVEAVVDAWDAENPSPPHGIDDVVAADDWARRTATTHACSVVGR